MKCPIHAWMIFIDFSHGKVLPDQCVQRPNSWTKSFLLGIHSHLYRFDLTPPLSVSRGQLLYTVNEKGGKPDKKTIPLPYGLINPYRNLMSENSQDYAQIPQRNCTFMSSASGLPRTNFHKTIENLTNPE